MTLLPDPFVVLLVVGLMTVPPLFLSWTVNWSPDRIRGVPSAFVSRIEADGWATVTLAGRGGKKLLNEQDASVPFTVDIPKPSKPPSPWPRKVNVSRLAMRMLNRYAWPAVTDQLLLFHSW